MDNQYHNPQIILTATLRVCLSVQSVIVLASYVKMCILGNVYAVPKKTCCCNAIHKRDKKNSILTFFHYTKTLFAATLGIEILCITAAEIGENSAFYFFGYHLHGIVLGYIAGYGLVAFTTFMTILGRYNFNDKIDNCCSILDQQSNKGFIPNLLTNLKNFGLGVTKIPHLYVQPNLKQILKTSIMILITAESGCILIAETIDLIFYTQSIFLSVVLALIGGSFVVVAPEAYRKTKRVSWD